MITDHPYEGELKSGASCQYMYSVDVPYTAGVPMICGRQAMDHGAEEESFPIRVSPFIPANTGVVLDHSYEKPNLGEVSTRDLALELRLRGDLAMTAMPCSPRGADGAVLSAFGSVLLKSCDETTLEAKRGE